MLHIFKGLKVQCFLKRPEVRSQADWNTDQPANPFVLPERLNQECLDFKAILDYTPRDRYVNKQVNQEEDPRGRAREPCTPLVPSGLGTKTYRNGWHCAHWAT